MNRDIYSHCLVNTENDNLNLCHTCSEVFSNQYLLKDHECTQIQTKNTQLTSNGIQLSLCDICRSTFSKVSIFKEHMDWHNNAPSIIMDVVPKEPRKVVSNSSEDVLKCPLCLRFFNTPQGLNNHMGIHTKSIERPHKCEQCPKTFNKVSHIKKHMFKHPYNRYTQPKLFNNPYYGIPKPKDERSHHNMTKTNIESFKCPSLKCLSTFPDPSKLSLHMKWVHPEVQRECPHCDETLQSKIEVFSHSDQANLSSGSAGFVCELSECNSTFKAI